MRTKIDQVHKTMLVHHFAPAWDVETAREVPGQVQSIDVWCRPTPKSVEHGKRLGWLGRMARRACLLEPFSKTPGPEEVRGCVRKHLNFHHDLVLHWQRDKKRGPRPEVPRLWILSPGVP